MTIVSATEVCAAQAPNGNYTIVAITGPKIPDNVTIQTEFELKDGSLRSTSRANDGTGWKDLGTATYRQMGHSTTWEMWTSGGAYGLLYYNETAGAWETIILAGRFPGRIARYVR